MKKTSRTPSAFRSLVYPAIFVVCLAVLTVFFPAISGLMQNRSKQSSAQVAPQAVTITANLTDNTAAAKNPGDTINYTATIQNSGTTSATGVVFSNPLSARTALVGGSIRATPIATNDAYSSIGNVGISVPDGASDLLANDLDPDGGTFTITTAPTTSTNGGAVSINTTTGSFTYNPPVGFEGTDNFTYTITDNHGLTNSATVSITVSGMIWFINNNAAACTTIAAGCGRLSNPFSTLAAFNTVNTGVGSNPADNDNIFIYESATAYTGGVTLRSGQKLIGQDATATLATITGVTVPTFSNALPNMNTGGSATTVQNGGGNAVTLNQGNTIRGLTVSGTSGAGIIGTSINNLTVGADVSLTGVAGTDFDLNGSANGAVSFAASITNTGGRSVSIQNRTGGTVGITGAISDSGTGILLNSNTGATITFSGGLSLNTGVNAAFTATGGGTVNVCDENPCNAAATGALVNTLTTTTGTALNVANTTIGANKLEFRSISANGAASGIVLNNTGANGLTVTGDGNTSQGGNNSGGTIQNTTGNAVSLTNTASPSFNNLNIQSAAGHGIFGTQVSNFSFTNGKINNVGDASAESCASFSTLNAVNATGTFTFTNSQCTQVEAEGVDLKNYGGTLSDVNISNNVFTDTGDVATPGSAVLVIANSTAASSAVVTKASLNNNSITDFRAGSGFVLQGVSVSPALPVTYGTPGSATNVIAVTGNSMNGGTGGIGNQPDRFVTGGVYGSGQGNINISNNGTSINRIRNIDCIGIELQADAPATLTTTVQNNFLNLNSAVGCAGLAIGTDDPTNANGVATHTTTVSGNNVQGTDGPGIYVIVRNSTGTMNATVTNNTVAAPITTSSARAGIRVDSGSSLAGSDTTLCLDLRNNTTAGSTNSGTGSTSPGINLRKQGTNPTVNSFGIEGMGATASPGVENYVNGLNTSTSGNFGTGGTALLSAASGFTNCSSAPIAQPADENAAHIYSFENNSSFLNPNYQTTSEMLATLEPFVKNPSAAKSVSPEMVKTETESNAATANGETNYTETLTANLKGVFDFIGEAFNALGAAISPTVSAQETQKTEANLAGETVTVNGTGAGFTIPAGESTTITFNATILNPTCAASVSTQGTVTGNDGVTPFSVPTNDPDTGAPNDATVTTVNKSDVNVTATVPATSTAAQSVTLTATVAKVGADTGCDPSGNVQFKVNGNNLGAPVALSGGTATLNTFALPIGASTVTAEYLGDASFVAKTSAGQPHTVNKATPVTVDDNFAGSTDAQDLGGGLIFNRNAFATIQNGINNVATGGTVNVLAGTYTGAVILNINATVNLNGDASSSGNLTVSNGTFNTSTGIFTLGGDFTQTGGTVDLDNGTFVFGGTVAQIFAPSASATFNNLSVNNAAGVTFNVAATVNGGLTLQNGNVLMGANLLTLNGTLTRTSGHVIGNLRKTLNSGNSFVYAVGTANGYSPLNVVVNSGSGDLTVSATQAVLTPPLNNANGLRRYWSLTATGSLNANLTFNYLDADLAPGTAATEGNYRLIRVVGGSGAAIVGARPNTVANTITATNISQFSDWTMTWVNPTAAEVTVGGRVLTQEGRGIYKARVIMVDQNGELHYAVTNPFGYYRFANVPAGSNITVNVEHKRYNFTPRFLQVMGEIEDFDFTALP